MNKKILLDNINYYSKIRLIVTVLLCMQLSACVKNNLTTTETIDPPTYPYMSQLQETAVKSGDGEWQQLSEGKRILFYSASANFAPIGKGEFKTTGVLQHPMIASTGFFIHTGNGFSFTSRNKETIILQCELSGDTALILSNNIVTPSLHVKYVHAN